MLTLWYDIPFSIRKQKGQTRGFHVLLGLQLVRFGISFFFYAFERRKRNMQKETKLKHLKMSPFGWLGTVGWGRLLWSFW